MSAHQCDLRGQNWFESGCRRSIEHAARCGGHRALAPSCISEANLSPSSSRIYCVVLCSRAFPGLYSLGECLQLIRWVVVLLDTLLPHAHSVELTTRSSSDLQMASPSAARFSKVTDSLSVIRIRLSSIHTLPLFFLLQSRRLATPILPSPVFPVSRTRRLY